MKAHDLKIGNAFVYKGNKLIARDFTHVKPGKGPAYLQVDAENITTKSRTQIRLRTDEIIEDLFITTTEAHFSYIQQDEIVFINQETFELITVNDVSFDKKLLMPDTIYTVIQCDDKIVEIKLPQKMEVTIQDADAVQKNQTIANVMKTATTTNGITLSVPTHIKADDKIIISTEDMKYVKRA